MLIWTGIRVGKIRCQETNERRLLNLRKTFFFLPKGGSEPGFYKQAETYLKRFTQKQICVLMTFEKESRGKVLAVRWPVDPSNQNDLSNPLPVNLVAPTVKKI